jgi:peptide/nickel transport system permease protein
MKAWIILKRFFTRLLLSIPLIIAVIVVTFLLLSIAPGDPAEIILGADATPERIAIVRTQLGLDKPLLVQWNYLIGIFTKLDFGNSYANNAPVLGEIIRTLPLTITLATWGITLSATIGVLVGVISAVKQYSFSDYTLRIVVLFLVSMPVFWLGLMLLHLFSARLGLLPSFGWGTVKKAILPILTLTIFPMASITRMTRANMLEVLRQDYIVTAKSKGLSPTIVIFNHALRNALIAVVTVIGVQFAGLLTGALLCETIFALPGMGRLTVNAVFARDYPIIRGAMISASIFVILVNLTVDLLYSILDPRIKVK